MCSTPFETGGDVVGLVDDQAWVFVLSIGAFPPPHAAATTRSAAGARRRTRERGTGGTLRVPRGARAIRAERATWPTTSHPMVRACARRRRPLEPAPGNAGEGSDMGDDAALVFAGGDRPPGAVTARLPAAALVIAADSGLDHAAALGRAVDLVVGDPDSVDLELLANARAGRAT